MAIDKNSNSYTFGFAILMVIVVGSLLAVASQGLKTRQEKNATDKKMMSILSAINIDATRENAQEMYNKYVIDSKIISGKDLNAEAFNVDIKKEFRDKNIKIKSCIIFIFTKLSIAEIDKLDNKLQSLRNIEKNEKKNKSLEKRLQFSI